MVDDRRNSRETSHQRRFRQLLRCSGRPCDAWPDAMFDGHYKDEVSVTRICFAPRRRKPNAAGVGAISELSYDATGPRPGRHVASFAASIAAHAAIVGLILCFASPVARAPGDWVLAYLVEGDRKSTRLK